MGDKKTYVLDTTVMIYDPEIFYKLGAVNIVVPLVAITELDGLKKSQSNLVAQSAREVSRLLDRISSYSDIREAGGEVSSGAQIFIETNYEKAEGLKSEADLKIIGTALYLKKKNVKNVILATTDTNMRIVGRTYGIKVEDMTYQGNCDLTSSETLCRNPNRHSHLFIEGKKRNPVKLSEELIHIVVGIMLIAGFWVAIMAGLSMFLYYMDIEAIGFVPRSIVSFIISVVLIVSFLKACKKSLRRIKNHDGDIHSFAEGDDSMKETWLGNPDTPWFQ